MDDLQKDLEISQLASGGLWVEKGDSIYDGERLVAGNVPKKRDRVFIINAHQRWAKNVKRAMAAEARIKKLEAVVEAAKVLAKWMQWWLDENLCECDGIHTCGRTQREQELNKFRQALAELEEGYN
jgi:hypothetical protein